MSNWVGRAKHALTAGLPRFMGMRACERPNPFRRVFAIERLEPRLALAAAGLVAVGSQPDGDLAGKIVYISPGHGYQYVSGAWRTGRGETQEMVEDFGTQDQGTLYADYLFRAGATVVPMRPIGHQTNEVVLDNDMTQVTYTGAWSNSTGSRYYDEDYGAVADAVHYRFSSASSTETATATYTPQIPSAGFYPVYAWASPGTNRTSQLYEVNHTGGQTQVRIDHSMVGNGWVYLGTYHFDAGSSAAEGSVQISNQGASPSGKVVIADAIRFGNGMGDVLDGASGAGVAGGTISGKPREDEAALMWVMRSIGIGVDPVSFFSTTTSSDPNVSAPARLAEHMNQNTNPFGTSLYLAIHSNAFDGTGRGAIGLISDSGTTHNPTPNQVSLATMLGRQVNQDMRALDGTFEHTWSTRTTYTYTNAYGEINDDDFINSNGVVEMDASLAEVGFHDNVQDAAIMRDPRGRDQIARSLYQATLEYFDTFGGLSSPVSTATPPVNVRAVSNTSGQVTLNWAAGPSTPSGVNGNAATDYRIYASTDGYGFDGGTLVSGVGTTTATLTGYDPTIPYYFRVVSVNAGGESVPSEVVTVLPSGGVKQVLIVNGFDRLDRTQDFRYTTPLVLPGGGNVTVDRVYSRYNNSFDYMIQVQTAIQSSKPGVHVASTSNEAVTSGAVNLNDYDTVIWITGTESSGSPSPSGAASKVSLDATEQTKLTSFINAGGNVFLSGAEIAWDLDQQNLGRTFYESTLKGNYVSDDAGTNTATADAAGIFAGLSSFVFSSGGSFNNLDTQYYNVATPDVIAPQAGAVSALTYSGGTGGTAAIQVAGTGGKGSIVMFGFPFEVMTSAARRQMAMGRILDFFALAPPSPSVDIKTRVNGQDADAATGPILAAGGTAAFAYVITNPGNVPLSGLLVKDNNGTPGNAADDFNATFTSGDTNSNSQLDVGETWTYSASRTVIAGQYTTTGTVTATGNAQSVSDTDAAHYFGSAPGVSAQSFIFGQDADAVPGLTLTAGDLATFTYVLTNTGNIALENVVVVDDNSTPGNAADDFNPVFSSGDSNSNGKLDLDETWTYTAVRTVIAGQHTHSSNVSASDSIAQVVLSSDPANYFGVAIENADFNSDGIVDSGDYVAWRKNDGLTGGATRSQGDANSDGVVDATDYNIWRAQFGTSVESIGQSSAIGAARGATFAFSATDGAALAGSAAALPDGGDTPRAALDTAFAALSASRHDSSRVPSRKMAQSIAANRIGHGDWEALLVELATRFPGGEDAKGLDSACTNPLSNPTGTNAGNPAFDSGVSVGPLLRTSFGRSTKP